MIKNKKTQDLKLLFNRSDTKAYHSVKSKLLIVETKQYRYFYTDISADDVSDVSFFITVGELVDFVKNKKLYGVENI